MRIAHLIPTYWPEVTRGSERFVHDLATAQAAAGDRVTILTGHLGRRRVDVEDGVEVVRRRRIGELAPLRHYELHVTGIPGAVREIGRGRFDLIHAHFPADALAASLARSRGGPPYVFTVHGLPDRRYLVSRRYRLELFERAAAGAAACTVWSEAAARPFRRYMRRDPIVIPPGVATGGFAGRAGRSETPTLICAASLGDPRKRAGLLLDAFERLRRRRPELRLRIVETRDPVMSSAVGVLPDGVELVAASSDPGELGDLYSSSWVGVLPAVEEAFGLVIVESLAAGTPVVADDSGAGPEILAGDERIGRVFGRDDPVALAEAVDGALELAGDPATVERCRARAAEYDWERLLPRWNALYEGVLEGAAPEAGRRTVDR